MPFRGPLPRYISATAAELRSDRESLPGVSSRPDSELLSAEEIVDIHMPVSVARTVIEATTTRGDRILDPFAGYGTTLLASEHLSREAVGVELLPEHAHIAAVRAPQSMVIEGDAHGLYRLVNGQFSLCFTAPPFRTKNEHPHDPLTGYELDGGDYSDYLNSLADIFRQTVDLLVPGGYLVVNAANMRFRGQTTLLAWDLAAQIEELIPFIAETTITWDKIPHDFTGDYLLCFQKPLEPR